ncbi:SlyX family protein [Pontiella agarivorans]|uniref:SlyX family protein n=1 Tax=Pontiella agarivorans TaxID=3038953 RepID=A0ABU5MV51_9BACT|nr:SlyX family protein [Pontiella agarivorans]MDZ8118089.1 SlyX family protein [Pontiella agarivorans]
MEERIIQLETLAAMQDKTIESLNEEIYRQQQDIARLTKRLERMEEKILQLQHPNEIAGNERPPHY